MPNVSGKLESIARLGRWGSSFSLCIEGQKVYVSTGVPSEKGVAYRRYERMVGKGVIAVYEDVNLEFFSTDRFANFLAGLFGFGKKPKSYRELKKFFTEEEFLDGRLLKDVFE